MADLPEIGMADFKSEVIDSTVPVLVDFYADWCGPCRAQGPMLERLASRLTDEAKIVKVNVDRNPELAGLFEVRSIPTLIAFNDGKISVRFVGLTSESALASALDLADS